MAINLRLKVRHKKHMLIGALCGTWHCPTCGPYLRRKWIEHLSSKLAAAEDLFVIVAPIPQWRTIACRIYRAGGQYVRIVQPGGEVYAFTDTDIKDAKPIVLSNALALLERVITTAISEHRPIQTTRGWGLPKTVPKLSEWERVGKTSMTVSEAERVVRAVGLHPEHFWSDSHMGFVVDLPDDWNEERIDAFDRMFCEPVGPKGDAISV